jgi:hypothetical protein
MNFLANLQSIAGKPPRRFPAKHAGLQPKKPPQAVELEEALKLGAFHDAHGRLTAISEDGVVDWDRFDVSDFVPYIASIATFERVDTAAGEPDFIYGVVGENIKRVAKRDLRGRSLREALIGPNRDLILSEYVRTLAERKPCASRGTVDISDMFWVHYLRFLYPVRRRGELRHLLCFVLFASRGDSETGFAENRA